MKKQTSTLSMVLGKSDRALLERLQKSLQKSMGIPVPYTSVARLALYALAEKHGVEV